MSKTQGKPLDTARGKRADPYYQAQDILSRRDHTEYEMRTKLTRKGFTTEDITKVIAWLQEKKLIDDKKYTARYISNTLQVKPVGPRWLSHKLKQKGIGQLIIENSLAEFLTLDLQKELARAAADSWMRQHKHQPEDKQKLQRFLLSRGFSFDVISHAVV